MVFVPGYCYVLMVLVVVYIRLQLSRTPFCCREAAVCVSVSHARTHALVSLCMCVVTLYRKRGPSMNG